MNPQDFTRTARETSWPKLKESIQSIDHAGIQSILEQDGKATQSAQIHFGRAVTGNKKRQSRLVGEITVNFPAYDDSMRFDALELALHYLEASGKKLNWDRLTISSYDKILTPGTIPIVMQETPVISRYARYGWIESLKLIEQLPKERHMDEICKALQGNLSTIEFRKV